ncbi:MAG: hypothetical protein WDN49_17585 [Acetobacteraceae bacterium]
MPKTQELVQHLGEHGAASAGAGVSSREHAALLAEVAALGNRIDEARRAISALDVDGIIAHAAAANRTILSACDTLDGHAAEMPASFAIQVSQATARIFTVCSARDIHGYRAAKAVRALKAIDDQVTQILDVFGPAQGAHAASAVTGRPE